MMAARLSKVTMTMCVAAFALVVAFNNVVDYDSNYAFVQHVLSMDTVNPASVLIYRAVAMEHAWRASYALIIAAECLTGLFLFIGALSLWRTRRAPALQFHYAKKWVYAGVTTGFIVWFFGFMVVGTEWFLMWQSSTWNGQQPAFRFYITLIGVLLFVNQPDQELPSAGSGESS